MQVICHLTLHLYQSYLELMISIRHELKQQ